VSEGKHYGVKQDLSGSSSKDAAEPRAVQPPDMGRVVAAPQVGGLHHRYERRAA